VDGAVNHIDHVTAAMEAQVEQKVSDDFAVECLARIDRMEPLPRTGRFDVEV
jgi:hypothetical protein